MATLEQIAKILGILSLSTSKVELTPERIEAYGQILGDISPDLLLMAAKEVAASNTFFPSAGELRRAAFAIMEKAEGTPGAWDAWAEVSRSFSSNGYYRGPPEWSHPLIGRAVDAIGGYQFLCHSENPIADRARFVQCYESLAERERDDRRMLPAVREKIEELAAGVRMNYLPGG